MYNVVHDQSFFDTLQAQSTFIKYSERSFRPVDQGVTKPPIVTLAIKIPSRVRVLKFKEVFYWNKYKMSTSSLHAASSSVCMYVIFPYLPIFTSTANSSSHSPRIQGYANDSPLDMTHILHSRGYVNT